MEYRLRLTILGNNLRLALLCQLPQNLGGIGFRVTDRFDLG
jgi:hypothetical protein